MAFFGNDSGKYTIEEKKLDLEAGFLGRFFGSKSSAPSNIAGLTILSLIFISLLGTAIKFDGLETSELWKITTPMITLILGYLFGKNN
ncbi:hypothetical protein [Aeromonas caviae]|uniref:hypothetical protein n=1 Tax=Aeromonas caviae TaxID=648 RepID=UPI0029D45AAA|nr:hypothetical protein [Aeromonas caviae]MDX7784868.1 hypothetical protein [Aeromonas caviae]